MLYRKDEKRRVWFRASRYFNVGDNHYFYTREGHSIGPFATRQAAMNGVNLYIDCLERSEPIGLYAANIAMQGSWARTLYA